MGPRKKLNVLIVAGEASGDRLGAALMQALQQRADCTFHGMGGPQMKALGLVELAPMDDIALMGIAEIVPSVFKIFRHLRTLAAWALAHRPDVVVGIDAQDFNARLAKRLRGSGIPAVQYVAPKAWAWRPGRVATMRGYLREVLCILPFEVEFFRERGLPARYVGHPMVDTLAPWMPRAGSTAEKALELVMMPGSRANEVGRHWPVFLDTFQRLRGLVPQLLGVLVVPMERELRFCRDSAPWGDDVPIDVVAGEARFERLAKAQAALSKSGTGNLELALLGTPAVVAYRMAPLTYHLLKRLVRVPYISLVNLIHRARGGTGVVFPEFIQDGVRAENLARAVLPMLNDPKTIQRIAGLMDGVRAAMATEVAPAEMAAQAVLDACGRG